EPDLAALDFVGIGPLVQPPLAPHLMLEVLHRVGDENLAARNSSIRQRTVEHPPGRADERLAREVFLIAWLLAHQHHVRGLARLARHRLGGVLVKRAARHSCSALASSASELIAGESSRSSCRLSRIGRSLPAPRGQRAAAAGSSTAPILRRLKT